MDNSAGLAPYHNMMMDLIKDGWGVTADPFARTRTHLICPADYLRMTMQTSTEGAVHCRLAIAQGGTGEPASWHASSASPPAAFWLACARAACRGVLAPQQVNLYPGDVLTRHGWKQLHAETATSSLRTVFRCPHGTSCVSYQPAQRALPALWSVTRPDVSVGILVSAAEPRALPALILAFALDPALDPTRRDSCCHSQAASAD